MNTLRKEIYDLLLKEKYPIDFIYFGKNIKSSPFKEVCFILMEENEDFIIEVQNKSERTSLLKIEDESFAIIVFYILLEIKRKTIPTLNARAKLAESNKSIPKIIKEYHNTYTNNDFDLINNANAKMRYFLKREENIISLYFLFNNPESSLLSGTYNATDFEDEKRAVVALMNKNYLIYQIYLTVEKLTRKGIAFRDFEEYIPFMLGYRKFIDYYYHQIKKEIKLIIIGAIEGTERIETLKKGTVIESYGEVESKYLVPTGTPKEKLSLAPPLREIKFYKYEVLKDFEVNSSIVAPWFDEIGGGTQYVPCEKNLDENTIEELITKKYLKEISSKKSSKFAESLKFLLNKFKNKS